MKGKRPKKSIQTTVRMSEEVNGFIWRMGKNTFAANLEAMVLFFMKREKILYDQVQQLETWISVLPHYDNPL